MDIQTHDKIADNLRWIIRSCEMSEAIMRDPERTQAYGKVDKMCHRVADQYWRIGKRAKETLDMLLTEPAA